MAPEVALCKPYTEKIDVHSFSIVIWMMARDRIPYHGMSAAEFKNYIINEGYRLKLDIKWPKRFVTLLQSCWDSNPLLRPSCEKIVQEIDLCISENEEMKRNWSSCIIS
jgi:hypothetical protein